MKSFSRVDCIEPPYGRHAVIEPRTLLGGEQLLKEADSGRRERDKFDAQAVSSPQLSGADLLPPGTLTTIRPLARTDPPNSNDTQRPYLR